MAVEKARAGKPLVVSFADATPAYFNAKPMRDLFIRAPKELGLPPNTMGRRLRCAYGTRDAGALWEEHYANVLLNMGFARGKAGPTCFHHPVWKVSVVVHGGDVWRWGQMMLYLSMRRARGMRLRIGNDNVLVLEMGTSETSAFSTARSASGPMICGRGGSSSRVTSWEIPLT